METLHHTVFTAVGDDRPGLVDEVTRYILERGGNVEDSRMVNLHGQFAMMMLVAGTQEVVDRMEEGLDGLRAASHLRAELRAADMTPGHSSAVALPYRLTTSAMDHPGLIHTISHLLGERGVNIESVQTELRSAPYTGAPLFEMELVVSLPAQTPVAELREALGRRCDELNIDWQLAAI